MDQKKYKPFRILKDIGQEVFQLKLLEGWMIYNMFNKDLLTRYRKSQFKGQHMKLILLYMIINKEEEYKVKEVQKHRKQDHETQYLVHWKDYGNKHDQ